MRSPDSNPVSQHNIIDQYELYDYSDVSSERARTKYKTEKRN